MTKNDYFNSQEFEQCFHYDGALGAFAGPWGSRFSLWAPTAQKVILKLYRSGNGEELPRLEPLSRGNRGVWTYQTRENLDGFYYRYEITVDGISHSTGDPYARACGVNGHRSMVLDLSRTNPEGWELDQAPGRSQENIIYEVNIKDFTWDPSSGVSRENRGKYAGLMEVGTTLNQDGIHSTGLDYLKTLGVTHIQLMPVYDFGSVDEAGNDIQFNWGYDPVNYNVPEGSYSSDPYHGEVRIRELKQLIQTLHKAGFRVIMDVVYNHTYRLDSFLNRTVPGYYYRFYDNGEPSNGSGCGNDTASERSMCTQYILDSILYWISEYHFDGFRFDLMGLMPVSLMNRIQETVNQKYGEGEILLYGEPWSADKTAARPGTILADKKHLLQLCPQVGAFCDTTRDAIKGSLFQENSRGFVNGGSYSPALHQGCLVGWAGVKGDFSVSLPAQTIGYLSCHDDWTLWDRLVNTLDQKKEYTGTDERVIQANRLAIALLFGCQGNLFLLSGEECGRTKQGVKNSFSSSILINRMDWNRVWKMEKLMDYYRGLFALRKQLPCLYEKKENFGNYVRSIRVPAENCAIVEYTNPAGHCRWDSVIILYNMSDDVRSIPLKEGSWQVLADETDSFLWKQMHKEEKETCIQAGAAKILGQ